MHERRETNDRVEAKFKNQDDIPSTYSIIYRAPFYNYVKGTYSISFFAAFTMPTVFALSMSENPGKFPMELMGITLASGYFDLACFFLGLCVITSQVAVTVFQCPLRIYLDSNRGHYIAMYQDIWPWKLKKEEFNAGEMKKSNKGIMPWKDSLYEFRSRKALLFEDHFRRPVDFDNMFTPKVVAKDS
ncbi:hypothetical protein AAG570_004410 [Ranatra chinensis]|uniref:Uncharacterized protein n=1 Tax=Ranatra chinensis TaxID=642074 RepID=A0ABD0Y0S0_9HEMI